MSDSHDLDFAFSGILRCSWSTRMERWSIVGRPRQHLSPLIIISLILLDNACMYSECMTMSLSRLPLLYCPLFTSCSVGICLICCVHLACFLFCSTTHVIILYLLFSLFCCLALSFLHYQVYLRSSLVGPDCDQRVCQGVCLIRGSTIVTE